MSEEEIRRLENRSKLLDTVASRFTELAESAYLIRQLAQYIRKDNPQLPLLAKWIETLSTGASHSLVFNETLVEAKKYVNERSVQ